jgi:transposase
MTLSLAKHMPISAVAKHVGEHDTRIWRMLHHYVDKAHAATSWEGMSTIAGDETAARKGHRYVTVVVDVDSPHALKHGPRLIFMTPGRKAESIAQFAREMPKHGAQPEQITLSALDMGKAFISGVNEHLPNAEVCLDRYHVMQLVGKAVDQERRYLQSLGFELKGALWALRGNAENLKEKHLQLRKSLCKEHAELGRCMALREDLQALWGYEDVAGPVQEGCTLPSAREQAAAHLKRWSAWAQRSRLEGFVKLARTLRAHAASILNYYPSHLTSAAIEAINGLLQDARRRAKGYRNFKNFRAIAYWIAGHLNLHVDNPSVAPTL